MPNYLSETKEQKTAKQVFEIVQDFIDKQNITCPETIYQTDWVIENAYEFIERLCNVVGYKEEE